MVVVVATFLSTMIINVSLSMAELTRLVFQVEIKQAQEEDFINPIYAVLESDDGYRDQQEIQPDTTFLTFENLEPGKEYLLPPESGGRSR